MSDSCLSINAEQLDAIATRYKEFLSANPARKIHVLTSAGISGEGSDSIKKYLETVIRSINKLNGNTDEIVMPKSTRQMDEWVDKEINKAQRDADILNRGRAGSVVIGGKSVGNPEIVGILDRDITIAGTKKEGAEGMVKFEGSNRQRIQNFVRDAVEAQLGRKLGEDESYKNVDSKFQSILELFEMKGTEFNGSVGDLFMIINMACCIKNDEQRPYCERNVIKQALAGDIPALTAIRSQYNKLSQDSANNISSIELDAMKLVLKIYAARKSGLDDALKKVETKNSIKAAANSTKHYRVLSNALRDRWEDVHNPKPLEIGDEVPWVRINLNDSFCKRVNQVINKALKKQGKESVDIVQKLRELERLLPEDKLVSIDQFARVAYEVAVGNLETEGSRSGRFPSPDGDVADDAVDIVADIAEWLFKTTNVGQGLRYSGVRNKLVDSGDREISVASAKYFPNNGKVVKRLMETMRKRFAAEYANFNSEALINKVASDNVRLSAEGERMKRLANNVCEVAFSTEALKQHAQNIAHNMISYAESRRWAIYAELKRRNEDKRTTDEQRDKNTKITADLCDDYTWLGASIKFLLRNPKLNGKSIDNIFDYAKERTIGKSKNTQVGIDIDAHWKALELRGLSELEAISGQRIILNDDNVYELKGYDDEEIGDTDIDNEGLSDQEKREAEDLEHNHDKNMFEFDDKVDPFSSLSANVRMKLSRIPKLDKDGKEIRDPKTGNVQYFDAKYVFNALLALISSRVLTPQDFYRMLPNSELNDTHKVWPVFVPLFNGIVGNAQTTKQAFPNGMPQFDVLQKVAAGEPWVGGLIHQLQMSFVDMKVPRDNDTAAAAEHNLGLFVTDLFGKSNFTFAERVIFRSDTEESTSSERINNLKTINIRGSVDSVRAVQRLNYMNKGIAYADEYGLINKEAGEKIYKEASALEDEGSIDVYLTRDKDVMMRHCDKVAEVLNNLGYDIPTGEENPFYMRMLIDENYEAAYNMEYLVAQIKNLGEVYMNTPNTESDDTMYDNHGGVWDHLHQAVGKFMNPKYFELTSNENGVTRQNMIAGSTLTKTLDMIAYGWDVMGTMSKDSRDEVLKERKRRIDERYGYLKKDGKYENSFLQAMYEGKDIPKDPSKARAGARFWGGFALLNNYDDKEFSALNEAQRLEVMLAGFLEQDKYTSEYDVGQGGALYLTPTLGDTKAAVFTRGKQRTRQECIDGMARFIREELADIAHNKMVGNRWLAIQATEATAINGHVFLHPRTGKWVRYNPSDPDWKAASILKKYRDAVERGDDEAIDEQEKAWEDLRKDNAFSDIKTANDKYEKYLYWQPTGTFFSSEIRINKVPKLNSVRLTVQDLVNRQVQRAVKAKRNTEEGATEYYTGQAKLRFGEDLQRMITVYDVYDAYEADIDPNEDHPTDAFIEDYKDLVSIFTGEGLEREYDEQSADMLQDEWQYKEKVTMHRIECVINGAPDYKGIEWEVIDGLSDQRDEQGKFVEIKQLRDKNNPRRRIDLSEKEYEYYQARKRGEYSKPTDEFKGDEGVHKVSTLRNFRPSFKNHGVMLRRVKKMKNKPNMDFNALHDVIKDLFYNMTVHNEELLEIIEIDEKYFKGTRDNTKRLRGAMANGTSLDSQCPGGREVENIIVYKDDVSAILEDYPNVVAAYMSEAKKRIKAVMESSLSAEEKKKEVNRVINDLIDSKIDGHANNNATNAQAYSTPTAWVQKARMGGSQHSNTRITKSVIDAFRGTQNLNPNTFSPDSSAPPMKTKGFGTEIREDPEGVLHRVPIYTKDTEVICIDAKEELGSPRSARKQAFLRACDNVQFVADGDELVTIHTMMSEEAMKSTRSGVIDMRYLQSRVDAVRDIIDGNKTVEQVAAELRNEMDNVMKSVSGTNNRRVDKMTDEEFVAFVGSMVGFIKACMVQDNNRESKHLSFDVIDRYVHNGSGMIKGLRGRTFDWLTGASEKKSREKIRELMNIRNFFMPVKSTESTVDELSTRNIQGALMRGDGKLNRSFVYKMKTSDQAFQLKFSNHSVDSKSNLGSQESYIVPTAIEKGITYSVAGHDIKGGGLLDLFNKCLAVRLFNGIADVKELFGNTEKAMRKLQKRIDKIAQNNPKLGEDVLNALQIIVEKQSPEDKGIPRFKTPLASVGIIYKISDVLTSFVRSGTHKRKINGAKVIVEGDIGYDDKLQLVRDPETNRIIGIECYLPATSEWIMKQCIVTKNINGKDVQVLDPQKLKEAGLDEIIAYRIPTEDLHSILPLIVKGFREQVHSGSIVVAGEVTTLTGGDNDGDGLFIMLKNVDPETGKTYEYDWSKPLEEWPEGAIENLISDIIREVVTHPSNEARFFSPQNPDTLKTVSRRIAYATLPNSKKLRKRVRRYGNMDKGEPEYVKLSQSEQTYEYNPDDPDWDNKNIFEHVEYYKDIEKIPYGTIADHIEFLNELPITSPFTVIQTGMQQALAKSGVAIASDGMSIFEKMLVALRIIGGDYKNGVEFEGDEHLPDGIEWNNGKKVGYCPEVDIDGNPVSENVNNYLAALVDSAKDLFTILIGLNEGNAAFGGFLLRCGFSPEMMSYAIAILNKHEGIVSKYWFGIKDSLFGEGSDLSDDENLGKISPDAFKKALSKDVITAKTLKSDRDVLNVIHCLSYLSRSFGQMHSFEGTTKFNSTKNGLSNEPASAVYKIVQVMHVLKKIREGKYPVKLTEQMAIHTGLKKEDILAGTFEDEDGLIQKIAMPLSQAYFTTGVESFMDVAKGHLFYANEAFLKMAMAYSDVLMEMPQDEAMKLLKKIHDEWMVFSLSDMNMVTHLVNDEGEEVETDFVEMRNFYKVQFPKNWNNNAMYPKGPDSELMQYAICKKLTYDKKTGKLTLNGDLRNEAFRDEIQQSLIEMANSTNPQIKKLAVDLFLYSYFADGLRFGPNSISNEFTSKFLSSDAFKEYNDRVAALCTMKIPNSEIRRFLQQFTICHAVELQLGPLYRLSASEVNKDGNKVKVEPIVDEISQQEVRRLEEWLAHEDSDGEICTDPRNNPSLVVVDKLGPSRKKEERILEFPARLMAKVDKLKNGEIFRVQTTPSLYDQNVYMVVERGTGKAAKKFVIKLHDFQNGIAYDKSLTLEEMAKINTQGNPLKQTPGLFDIPGSTAKKSQKKRKDTLTGKRLITKKSDSDDSGPRSIDEMIRQQNTPPAIPSGGMMTMPRPENSVPLFIQEQNVLMAGDDASLDTEEIKDNKTSEKIVYRKNDKAKRHNLNYKWADEEDEISEHRRLDDTTSDNSEEAKAQALRDAGADGTFRNERDAITAAHRVNGYIPNVVRDGSYFKVELHDSNDSAAADVWADQYGRTIMSGPDGMNDVMRQFGNEDVDFIDTATYDEYDTAAKDIIGMVDAAANGEALPAISRLTAESIVKKLRGTSQRMIRLESDIENAVRNGLPGMTNEQFLEIFGRGDFAAEISSADEDEREIAVTREVGNILVEAAMNPKVFVEMLKNRNITDLSWLADRIDNMFIEKTLLSEINRAADPRVGNIRENLATLRNEADVSQSYTTPEEQRRMRENRARTEHTRSNAERLKKIVEDALVMEERKRKMTLEERQKVNAIDERIEKLRQVFGDRGSVSVHGVLRYLESVTKEYGRWLLFFRSLSDGTTSQSHQDILGRLAMVSKVLKSHEGILQELNDLMKSEFPEKNTQYHLSDGTTMSLAEMVTMLSDLHAGMRQRFTDWAPKEVIAFIKEFTGESYAIKNADGTHVTWEQLFYDKHGDISWTDQILRSMGNTKDPIGQVVDTVIKMQKDRVRRQSIIDQQTEIKDLYDFCESEKLTDFEWMFEHDAEGHKTGYYITECKNAEFFAEHEEQIRLRDEVLNSPEATDAQKEIARNRYNAWVEENGTRDRSTGFVYPSPTKAGGRWKSDEYEAAMRDPKKKKFHEKFMKIKKKYDDRLGQRTANARAIQRRMTSEQRFRANFSGSFKGFFDNMKRKLADDFLVREDDYMEAGERSTVLDYDGTPRMLTPAPYVRMLKNPDELSTDLIGCLMAYSYATNNYVAMREVTSPLEVMFEALVDSKITYDERDGIGTVENFTHSKKQKAVVSASRFFKKLRSYLDTQLYMRYNQDEEDTFTLFNRKFRKSKTVAAFLHMSAVAQLGFNWLVDMASLANGILQTNIEAAARRYFSGSSLRKADAIYWKELKDFMPDLARPFKQSKLALVSQALDIQQNFDLKLYNNARHQLLSRIFNSNIAFLGTTGGNHWLYHRVALAMMMETQVTYTNESGQKVTTNLWDAFYLKDTENGGKIATIPADAVDTEGNPIDEKWLYKFGERIDGINHDLVGIYNRDDMNMAQKVWYGKLLMAFHKHIIPLFDRRWRGKHYDKNLERDVQGYMLTLGEFLKGIRNAQFNIPAAWDELDEFQKQDVRAALADIVQFCALLILGNLLLAGGDDDDDEEEKRLKKWCKFLLAREAHEMGSFINPLTAGKEAINILNNPVAGTSQLEDIYNFAHTAVTPWTWDEKVKAGPFQGQSQLEMRTRKLPISVLSYYRNIDKSMNGIDNSTWFYNRGYAGKV